MSNTKENTILAFEKTNEKEGAWLKCKSIGDDGKERNIMITEPVVIEQISKLGTGVYEFSTAQDGIYKAKDGSTRKNWKVTNAKFLRPLTANVTAAQPTGNPGQLNTPRNPGQTDPNTTMQNRSITSQVAMKVAGEVMGIALTNGAFKIEADNKKPAGIDVGALSEAVNILAGMLMDTAGKFSTPKIEEHKNNTYKDEDGRTHEPVNPAEGA